MANITSPSIIDKAKKINETAVNIAKPVYKIAGVNDNISTNLPVKPVSTATLLSGQKVGLNATETAIRNKNLGTTPPVNPIVTPATGNQVYDNANPHPETVNNNLTNLTVSNDFTAREDKAYNDYSSAISLTPEQKNEKAKIESVLTNPNQESFADMYTRMQNEGNYQGLSDVLNKTNEQITSENKGLTQAQEQIFNSSGGVTDAGVSQLRAYNSKDFIRNLSDLSNIQNNTVNQLNALNSNIDNIIALRKTDRETTRQNLLDRLELIKNSIDPNELELMKAKLSHKLAQIDKEEQVQADIAKVKTNDLLTNGDINSKDEFIQNKGIEKAINDLYTQFPIAMVETKAEKIQRVKDMIAGGTDPAEAIKILRNEITSTDRYKNLQIAQQESLKTKPTESWTKLNDTTLYNQVTGESKSITSSQSNAMDLQVGDKGGECGTFARKYTGISGSLDNVVGKTINERKQSFTEAKPVEGGLVFMTGDNYDKTYGHIAVVKSINQNGSINIIESNLDGKGTVSERTLTSKDKVFGYYNDTPLAKGENGVKLSQTDISNFNNPTFKPSTLKTQEQKDKYNAYQDKIDSVYNNPNADFYDVIRLSDGSGRGSVSERDKVGKYAQVLGGLDTLTGLVNSQSTGPIVGRLKELNPYSTDVAEFKAVIAGLVPSVARGIFNEVGVLTDNDVQNYLKTLPTLTKTQDQNKLVVGALLKTLRNGMKSQLGTMARSGVNVSKFEGSIKKMDETINQLESSLKGNSNTINGKVVDTNSIFDKYY